VIFAGPGIGTNAVCRQPAELLDIFPTLLNLCHVAGPDRTSSLELEGHSLVPQLQNASAPREWPAITTHGPDNHAVRDERWRYIRYADGSEELYDHGADPNEWTNLAADPAHAGRKAALSRWLPKRNAPPTPGSFTRLVEIRGSTVYWEGEPINRSGPIPQ
jgi:arylsulfatase A-like enzyme